MEKSSKQQFFQDKKESVDLVSEIFKYLSYWKWFVLFALLSLSVAFLYLRYTPETFQSFSKIKILGDEANGLAISSDRMNLFSEPKNLENEIAVIKSNRLLKKVVDSLDLHIRYFIEGQFKRQEVWKTPFKLISLVSNEKLRGAKYFIEITSNGYKISSGENHENKFVVNNYNLNTPIEGFPFLISSYDWINNYRGLIFTVTIQSIGSAANQLSNQLTIQRMGTTDILQISMIDESSSRSEAALNKIVDQFNLDGIEDRQLVSQRTIDFVNDRFIYLEEELDSIEVDKRVYQQDNNLVSFESDAGYSMSKRSSFENQVFQLESQLALARLLESPLIANDDFALLPANLGLDNGNINGLIQNYNSVVLERDKLITSAGENNPAIVVLEAKIRDLKYNLENSLQSYFKQLNTSLSQLRKEEDKAYGLVRSLPQKQKVLRSIERQQNLKENLYLLLLQKREEAAINLAITSPSIKIIEHAFSSGAPISPNSKSIYIKSLLVGLLIPFGVLFLIFKLDDKIYDKKDIQNGNQSIPIIGEIPKLEGAGLFSNPHDKTILAESFRILSTNLSFVLPSKAVNKSQIVLVTSTIKGEGKTFVSVNLALAFSSINKKVLLIGADLRNPKINLTEGHKKALGLSDYLVNPDSEWKSYLQESKYNASSLDVLTSGTIPPNPTELLSNGRLNTLLEEAKELYDYIIIDTAPVILVTDTLLISKYADATIYVARAGFTEKKLVNFSNELFVSKKLKNVVYVLNDLNESKFSRGYGYNYGYGYGYHTDVVIKKFSRAWFKKKFHI
ncbi:GumC family protein [Formosa haliotis]|uniref:GumC family protein n=1 Tax=Formosa haliotis TaxID=1555194 RepID=UPI0008258B14|nr:tyrosine-protein kinase family protein [Formosa haliotis]